MKRTLIQLALFNGPSANKLMFSLLSGIEAELLEGLSEKQKDILTVEHSHQVDPNGYNPAETLTLLKRLLRESGLYPDSFFREKMFQCNELYLYDLHAMTGVRAVTIMKEEIPLIDRAWRERGLAGIAFESRPSAVFGAPAGAQQHFLMFELL